MPFKFFTIQDIRFAETELLDTDTRTDTDTRIDTNTRTDTDTRTPTRSGFSLNTPAANNRENELFCSYTSMWPLTSIFLV